MAEDKVYKCLNPVGIQNPIETFPLAPRLKSLDGKEIWISITGEPDITIALEKKLKMDYPNVNWKQKKTYGIFPVQLSDEEMKTADGVIQAMAPGGGESLRFEGIDVEERGLVLNNERNVVDVFVGYLRRKLESGGEPRLLHTIRGVGFVLRVLS